MPLFFWRHANGQLRSIAIARLLECKDCPIGNILTDGGFYT
jgi:hypothetical protein